MIDKLHRDIGFEISVFTTAIFPASETRHSIDPPGTGTFIYFKGSHYILTAAHVWEKVNKGPEMGLTLKEGVRHPFLIPTPGIQCFGPPWPNRWNEWGPDIALLRLPPQIVGEIKTYRAFYDWEKNRAVHSAGIEAAWEDVKPSELPTRLSQRALGKNAQLEGRALTGVPKEFAHFTQGYADVELNTMFLGVHNAREHTVGAFDYVDLDVDTNASGVPSNFEGVSGGGLWRFVTTISDEGHQTTKILEGVVFYQLPESGRLMLRCHGIQSLLALKTQFANHQIV